MKAAKEKEEKKRKGRHWFYIVMDYELLCGAQPPHPHGFMGSMLWMVHSCVYFTVMRRVDLNVRVSRVCSIVGPPTMDNRQPDTTPAAPAAAAATAAAAAAPPSAPAATRMQLIDEEQHIHADALQRSLEEWSLAHVGFGYDLCAVLGSQSTGKSTLLNGLFGTSFDVMDERQRRQTTKGVWLSRSSEKNVLVMDVEGTDGRERGEDQDFERKSSLFALATAECLIVNMWENQVGLYQGANMGLLKTVLDVNLSLFRAGAGAAAAREKTLLMFVIRDYVGLTPLSNLEDTITADLERIWASLSKPSGLEEARLTDFFDIAFAALPHKVLQAREFADGLAALRTRFVDPAAPDYVFQTQYHKRIPADGLPHFLAGVWDQIVQNKDLDLPTQQELLAQFRCDEIAEAAFGTFSAAVGPFRKALEGGGILATLGADMGTHRGTALSTFDRDASRYHPHVYARKRADLLARLNTALAPYFVAQLKNLHKSLVREFRARVQESVREPGYDFGALVAHAHTDTLAKYEAAAAAVLLADTDWSTDDERSQFVAEIEAAAHALRAEESAKMIAQIEKELKKTIAEPVALALARPVPAMWDNVLEARSEAVHAARSAYVLRGKSLNCTPDEDERALAALERRGWIALFARIREQTADEVLSMRLQRFFEEQFRYDAEGVPRVWRPTDDIDGVFVTARDNALALIPLYARVEPESTMLKQELEAAVRDTPADDELDIGAELQVLSTLQCADIGTRLRRDADAHFVEAKRSTVSGISQVPLWMYVVLVVLGWNEAMAVLYSPVYFTLLCLALASAYIVWRLNMSGPLFTIVSALTREVQSAVEHQLREYLAAPRPAAHAAPVREAPVREAPAAEEHELAERQMAGGL